MERFARIDYHFHDATLTPAYKYLATRHGGNPKTYQLVLDAIDWLQNLEKELVRRGQLPGHCGPEDWNTLIQIGKKMLEWRVDVQKATENRSHEEATAQFPTRQPEHRQHLRTVIPDHPAHYRPAPTDAHDPTNHHKQQLVEQHDAAHQKKYGTAGIGETPYTDYRDDFHALLDVTVSYGAALIVTCPILGSLVAEEERHWWLKELDIDAEAAGIHGMGTGHGLWVSRAEGTRFC
jgi:hypothetical protein